MSSPAQPAQIAQVAKTQDQPFEQMQVDQPRAHQPMNSQQPHPDTQVTMRGGNRGGPCPGRFCFCIPCPLPCDFCII